VSVVLDSLGRNVIDVLMDFEDILFARLVPAILGAPYLTMTAPPPAYARFVSSAIKCLFVDKFNQLLPTYYSSVKNGPDAPSLVYLFSHPSYDCATVGGYLDWSFVPNYVPSNFYAIYNAPMACSRRSNLKFTLPYGYVWQDYSSCS